MMNYISSNTGNSELTFFLLEEALFSKGLIFVARRKYSSIDERGKMIFTTVIAKDL